MIDIVNFYGDMFPLGFSKVYHSREFNIATAGENRKIVEDKRIDILLDPWVNGKNNGLNDAICKLARKNQVAVGFSFSRILESKDRNKAIAGVMQNIRLCRKYKVKMVMASFASNKYQMRHGRDLYNLCIVLGMDENNAKEALSFKKKEILPRLVQ